MRRIEEMDTKGSVNTKIAESERRIALFYSDQENNCTNKAKEVSSIIQKKLDKISTKADNALKCAKATVSSTSTQAVPNIYIESKIKNLAMDVEKLEHEIAGVCNQINDMLDENRPL